MKYYDTTTKGFYEEMSDGRLELTEESWQALLNKQAQGGVIQSSGDKVFCVLPTEEIQNGELIDVSETEAYKSKVLAKENSLKKADLYAQIDAYDTKSIRALREGGIYDEMSGKTYLEYYTEQIVLLRSQIAEL